MKKQQTATVPDIFARALDACVPPAGSPVGIALSGGLDSAALLHLAHAWRRSTAWPCTRFTCTTA